MVQLLHRLYGVDAPDPHQSLYCRYHSTETALLYIEEHLISAIGSQKLSCLCILHLSDAFDALTIRTARFLQVFTATENSLCLLFHDNAVQLCDMFR